MSDPILMGMCRTAFTGPLAIKRRSGIRNVNDGKWELFAIDDARRR